MVCKEEGVAGARKEGLVVCGVWCVVCGAVISSATKSACQHTLEPARYSSLEHGIGITISSTSMGGNKDQRV